MVDVFVGLCGEMGGRLLEVMVLIGLGIGCLLIMFVAIGLVKVMIWLFDVGVLRECMVDLLVMLVRMLWGEFVVWVDSNGVVVA